MRALKTKFLVATLALIVLFVFFVNASTPPIKVKVVNAPPFLVAGQSYTFTLEVQNIGKETFTFPLFPGFHSSVFWQTRSGASGGFSSMSSCSLSCTLSAGKFVGENLRYKPNNFATLQPKESRQINVTVDTPEAIQARRAAATVNFQLDSDFDGKDLGLTVWTGTFEFDYELPIVKKARGK